MEVKDFNAMGNNADAEAFDELATLFGVPEDEQAKIEETRLTEDLSGFASCFPSWDLHPPVRK